MWPCHNKPNGVQVVAVNTLLGAVRVTEANRRSPDQKGTAFSYVHLTCCVLCVFVACLTAVPGSGVEPLSSKTHPRQLRAPSSSSRRCQRTQRPSLGRQPQCQQPRSSRVAAHRFRRPAAVGRSCSSRHQPCGCSGCGSAGSVTLCPAAPAGQGAGGNTGRQAGRYGQGRWGWLVGLFGCWVAVCLL